MTDEQKHDLVKECGLDWHRGFMPLFEGDTTNRYSVLIDAVQTADREACAKAVAELQAQVDHLMLEYCPYDMTGEQLIRWAHRGNKPTPPSVPDGWVLVPVEPTDEMLRRARSYPSNLPPAMTYQIMLAAAPKQGDAP